MGNVASRDIYNKSGTTTGTGLDTLAKNQGAMREGVGMLPPKDVTIQDGAITAFEEAALIVDTEGGAAADDLNVINDVLSSTEKLHPGMLITLRAKDPARVVTVKNSAAANGINTADGKDIVLSPDWELTLRLVGGKWYEVRGRSGAQADAAQSTANNAKAVTDKVTPTPAPNAVPQADGDGKIAVGWIPGLFSGDIRLLPFSPAALATYCPGWHFCNGDKYALTSNVGAALNALPSSFKTAWGITVSGSNISIPNLFYSDGRGVYLRAVNGTTRQIGSVELDALQDHTHTHDTRAYFSGAGTGYDLWVSVKSAQTGGAVGARVAAETSVLDVGMAPAIFLGV